MNRIAAASGRLRDRAGARVVKALVRAQGCKADACELVGQRAGSLVLVHQICVNGLRTSSLSDANDSAFQVTSAHPGRAAREQCVRADAATVEATRAAWQKEWDWVDEQRYVLYVPPVLFCIAGIAVSSVLESEFAGSAAQFLRPWREAAPQTCRLLPAGIFNIRRHGRTPPVPRHP
jgi:hypothetical protein